jgi:hypothetical protein
VQNGKGQTNVILGSFGGKREPWILHCKVAVECMAMAEVEKRGSLKALRSSMHCIPWRMAWREALSFLQFVVLQFSNSGYLLPSIL